MVTSLTVWSTWPWLSQSAVSLTVFSQSSSRLSRPRFTRLGPTVMSDLFCLIEIFSLPALVTKPGGSSESCEAARQLQHDVLHDEREASARWIGGGGCGVETGPEMFSFVTRGGGGAGGRSETKYSA